MFVFQICNTLPSHLPCIYSYFVLIYLICCFSHVIRYCLYKRTWRLHHFFLIVFKPSPITRSYRIFVISYPLYRCWCSHSFESVSLTLTWFWASWNHFPSKSLALDSWVLRWFIRKFISFQTNVIFVLKGMLVMWLSVACYKFSVSFNSHNRPKRQASLSPLVRWRSWDSESLCLLPKTAQRFWDLTPALPCSESCFLTSFPLLPGLGAPLLPPVCPWVSLFFLLVLFSHYPTYSQVLGTSATSGKEQPVDFPLPEGKAPFLG